MTYLLVKDMPLIQQSRVDLDTDTVVVEYNLKTIPHSRRIGTLNSCPIDDPQAFEAAKSKWDEILAVCASRGEENMILSRAYFPVGSTSLMYLRLLPLVSSDADSLINCKDAFQV